MGFNWNNFAKSVSPAYKIISDMKGSDSPGVNVNIPDYYQDPLYQKTQDTLYSSGLDWLKGNIGMDMPSYKTSPYYTEGQDILSGLGKGLISGNIPEYYKGIGESNGIDFNNMLNLANRDVTRGVNEDIVRRGVTGGGVGTSAIAKAISDSSIKARFEDYSRSMEGRKALLAAGIDVMGGTRTAGLQEAQQANLFGLDTAKLGIGIRETGLAALGDVRGAALTAGGQQNTYNLSKAGIQVDLQKMQLEQDALKAAKQSQMWSSILGAVGTIGGFMVGGPVGAGVGGAIGSGSTTGTTRFRGI